MKKEVEAYISGCETCGRTKPQRTQPEGLLNPLQIAEGPWKSVSMDYIVELPVSDGFNAILVIVDRFTKMSYFIPTTTHVTAKETATLFMKNVFLNHGIPKEVVYNRGPVRLEPHRGNWWA